MIKGRIKSASTNVRPSSLGGGSTVSLTLSIDDKTNAYKDLLDSSDPQHKVFIYRPEDVPTPWGFVKDVYVNEDKRTVVVKFKDGKVVKKTACEGDTFDVYAGVALCLATYMSASTKNFHNFVDRRVKNSSRKYDE